MGEALMPDNSVVFLVYGQSASKEFGDYYYRYLTGFKADLYQQKVKYSSALLLN